MLKSVGLGITWMIMTKANAIRFVHLRHEGKTLKDAGMEIGYAESTALKDTSTLTENPLVKEAEREYESKVLQELEKKYPNLALKLAEKLDQGMDATRAISAIIHAATGAKENSKTEFVEVPDYGTRHKYVATTLELMGEIGDKRKDTSGNVFNISMLVNLVRLAEKERGLEPL